MQAGRLDKRVTIEAPPSPETEANRTTLGTTTAAWTLVCKRWAGIYPVAGGEGFQAGQVIAEATHRVELRADEDTLTITPGMRVVYGSRTLYILDARNVDEDDWELHLTCQEKRA